MKPFLSYDELKALAQRKALVRWHPSGKVERLRICQGRSRKKKTSAKYRERYKGLVLAGNLTGKEHVIWPIESDQYFCVEIDPKTPVCVGDLLPKETKNGEV